MADDGLQFLLELDAEIGGATDALKVLTSLDAAVKKLDANLDKMTGATASASAGHARHAKSAEHLGGVFQRLTSAALHPFLHRLKEIAEFEFIRRGVDKILEAPFELIEAVKELGEEMLITAGKAQRTESSFKLLFGAEGADELLEGIEGIARNTEFADDALKSASQTLGRVGFQGEGLNRALAASLDIAAFSPDAAAGMNEALGALERIKRTGRVDNRVLGGLGLGESAFLEELSKRTGLGTKALKKKMDAGKVDAEDSLEALFTIITNKTGKALGGAGAEMSKTFLARLTHLKDIPEQIFEGLSKSPAFERLSDRLGTFYDALNPESPLGKRVFGALDGALGHFVDLVESIDVERTVDAFNNAVTAATALLNVLLKIVGLVEGPLALFSEKGRGQIAEGAGRLAKKALGGDPEKSLFQAVKGAVLLETPINFLFDKLGSKPNLEWVKVGDAAGAGLAKGMKDATSTVEAAGGAMAAAAPRAGRDALGVHSPSRVFAELGAMSAAGFVEGIEASAAAVDDAVGKLFEQPAGARAGAGGGGAAVVIDVGGVTVTVAGGGDARETGEAIATVVAAKLAELAPGAVGAALEQLAMQAGAAR